MLDPGADGAAEAIKAMTGGRGADVCIEVSGAPPRRWPTRSARWLIRRASSRWASSRARSRARLGAEFHHNRVELICSQISGVAPEASHRWSKPRLWRTAIELQHRGVLDLLPLITHTAPFAEAPALFARLDAGEPGLLQAMLTFEMTLRVGMLGCGGIAARHAGAVAALGDRDDARRVLRARPGADRKPSPRSTAAPPSPISIGCSTRRTDLVIVTMPPFCRAMARPSGIAARGVHLLVEKPIALDMAAADGDGRSGRGARASSPRSASCTASATRCGPGATRDTGPRRALCRGAYHCNALHAAWWRDEAKSGGQILEQLIHLIDLVRHFMGEPDSVYARRANLFHADTPGYDVEDVSAIIFGWDDGRIATLNANNIATTGIWHKEWAVCSPSHDRPLHRVERGRFHAADGAPRRGYSQAEPSRSSRQLADLADAIRDGGAPLVPLQRRGGDASPGAGRAAHRPTSGGRSVCVRELDRRGIAFRAIPQAADRRRGPGARRAEISDRIGSCGRSTRADLSN